tara:strand:- start:460 stop:1089 length:630 start_codon:yes stop_codon:yes gene_type:complete
MSDMNGQKSVFFKKYCSKHNISFLSFDFRGHGQSSGNFTDYGVGDWYKDLNNLINYLKLEKFILVGSSMGGWVSMLYSLKHPNKVSKLIGLAAAPDFTDRLIWNKLTKQEKKTIKSKKILTKKVNKNFSYQYSLNLFKNSKDYLIKNIKKKYHGETILFHGSEDISVPKNYNDFLLKNRNFPNLVNVTINEADHKLSDELSLKNIVRYI